MLESDGSPAAPVDGLEWMEWAAQFMRLADLGQRNQRPVLFQPIAREVLGRVQPTALGARRLGAMSAVGGPAVAPDW